LFNGRPDDQPTIRDTDATAAAELSAWHSRSKRRLWESAQADPWGGAYYGNLGFGGLPPRAETIAALLDRREQRKAVQRGVPAGEAESGSYVFIPDQAGVPCGDVQMRRIFGPSLSPAAMRRAINEIESLAGAANRQEMHYDFGIWCRTSSLGIAAAVHAGNWAALVAWDPKPLCLEGGESPRVLIKSIWVAKQARRHGLCTSLAG